MPFLKKFSMEKQTKIQEEVVDVLNRLTEKMKKAMEQVWRIGRGSKDGDFSKSVLEIARKFDDDIDKIHFNIMDLANLRENPEQ